MEILILFVTHNGAETIEHTINGCLANTRNVPILVVDNASSDGTVEILRYIHHPMLKLISWQVNRGLGAAFNAGIAEAVSLGVPWMLIVDQDSHFSPECIEKLWKSADDLYNKNEPIAAIAPTVRSRMFPEIIHYPLNWNGNQLIFTSNDILSGASKPVRVDSPISSGTLYRLDSLTAVQGFRESYFIDFIDHECHLRLRQAGYTLWWEPQAVLYHELGAIQRKIPSGFWVEHPPYRYYYMARNMSEGYYRLGGMRSLLYFWQDAFRHMGRIYRNGRSPYTSIGYILRGCWDAILGKNGPLPAGR